MTFKEFYSSSEPITLESVKEKLTHWRATSVKGNRIPKPLWEAVRRLTKQYDYNQIASELKLNPHRLKAKIEKKSKDPSFSSTPDFIEFPLPPLSSPSPLQPTLEQKIFYPPLGTIELTRPDGSSLKATGLGHKELLSFVDLFLGS